MLDIDSGNLCYIAHVVSSDWWYRPEGFRALDLIRVPESLQGALWCPSSFPAWHPTHQSASFVFTDFQGVGITTSEHLIRMPNSAF